MSLFLGVQLTDVHIIDEENPLRLVTYDSIVQSAYRMKEMFNGHVLDAMVRTINRLDGDFPAASCRWVQVRLWSEVSE